MYDSTRDSPVNEILWPIFLGVVGKSAEVRRSIRQQQLIITEGQQTRQRRFDRISDVALRFGLGEESLRERRRRSGAKRLDFYTGIFCFECAGDLLLFCSAARVVYQTTLASRLAPSSSKRSRSDSDVGG